MAPLLPVLSFFLEFKAVRRQRSSDIATGDENVDSVVQEDLRRRKRELPMAARPLVIHAYASHLLTSHRFLALNPLHDLQFHKLNSSILTLINFTLTLHNSSNTHSIA